MAYVDLNPIRAGIAKDLTDSHKTSVKQRLAEVTQQPHNGPAITLSPFAGPANKTNTGLPFNLQDYLDLIDWAGRCVREDKRGAIDANVPHILSQLGLAHDEWLPTVTERQSRFESVIGSPEKMKAHAEARGGHFYRGIRSARRLYLRLAA